MSRLTVEGAKEGGVVGRVDGRVVRGVVGRVVRGVVGRVVGRVVRGFVGGVVGRVVRGVVGRVVRGVVGRVVGGVDGRVVGGVVGCPAISFLPTIVSVVAKYKLSTSWVLRSSFLVEFFSASVGIFFSMPLVGLPERISASRGTVGF